LGRGAEHSVRHEGEEKQLLAERRAVDGRILKDSQRPESKIMSAHTASTNGGHLNDTPAVPRHAPGTLAPLPAHRSDDEAVSFERGKGNDEAVIFEGGKGGQAAAGAAQPGPWHNGHLTSVGGEMSAVALSEENTECADDAATPHATSNGSTHNSQNRSQDSHAELSFVSQHDPSHPSQGAAERGAKSGKDARKVPRFGAILGGSCVCLKKKASVRERMFGSIVCLWSARQRS